jgi:hypothetical protein
LEKKQFELDSPKLQESRPLCPDNALYRRKMIVIMNIEIETIRASSLDIVGKGNELLIDILQKTNATTYLSGIGARGYMDPSLYDKANIGIAWQAFKHPVYPQLFGEFIPFLSSIDLLFNCGIDQSRLIIRSC